MRLTLRTLLAYLDDTLPPAEAKALGSKLAESEPAQEIVERIKNVIRRRRLTVPPATNRIDPNTLAEYLDNEITPELAEELERVCLSSDVHLAEVAACHQILSLVLGEPAAAPEGAVKRMYGLGSAQGRIDAAKPKRKPADAALKPEAVEREADETLRMGLPSIFGKDRANRWMIVAGGALASLLLVVAVLQLTKRPEPPRDLPPREQIAAVDQPKEVKIPEPAPIVVTPKPVEKIEVKIVEPKVDPHPKPPEKKPEPAAEDLPPPAFSAAPDKKIEAAIANIPFAPASVKIAPIGVLLEPEKNQASVVLQQLATSNEWKKLTPRTSAIVTGRPLVALPGTRGDIVIGKKLQVTLWGNLPSYFPGPPLYESMVEFHDHDTLDLDMTQRRGRVLITNLLEQPAVVRIRFENPSEPGGPESFWLLTLQGKNAEALIDHWSTIPPGEPFFKAKDDPDRHGPDANVTCLAIAGTIFLKTPTDSVTLQPAPKVSLAWWPTRLKKLLTSPQPAFPFLDPKTVVPPDLVKLRGELNMSFAKHAIDVALAELMRANDPLARTTAVHSLAAIDDLAGVFDALGQDKLDQRIAAIQTLVYWNALSRDNDYKLNEVVRQKLKANEADVFMTLLHGFSAAAAGRPETYEMLIELLKHNQTAIRELAVWNLHNMVPTSTIPYDGLDPAARERAYQAWRKLIPPGKLPPAPKTKAALTPEHAPLLRSEIATPAARLLAPREVEIPREVAAELRARATI